MSTNLMTYLNFIAGLENATDQQIQDIIDERAQFIQLGQSDMMAHCDASVDSVFDKIHTLAKQLEEEEIAEESVKLAEDAAAVAAIWSFGIGMAAYAALFVTEEVLKAEIKKKEDDLNNHLKSADQDISDKMGGCCAQYIDLTKKNNNYIAASSPKGLTPQTARSYLYNFMDYISRNGGVTVKNFQRYILVARLTIDDAKIKSICNILDEFTLSGDHGEEKIKEVLKKMKATGLGPDRIQIVTAITFAFMECKLKITAKAINRAAAEAGVPPEEAEVGVLKRMGDLDVAMGGFIIVVSLVDVYLNVYLIVDTVERYKKNCKIFADARGKYKEFYKTLYDASVKYNKQT